MKRIPLALVLVLAVVCLTAFALFSERRASAKRQPAVPQNTQPGKSPAETQIARPERVITSDDGKVSTGPEGKAQEPEFVPGEVLVKFKSEKDANEAALGRRTTRGTLSISNSRLNDLFARFSVEDARKAFIRAKAKGFSRVVKLTTRADQRNPEVLKELVAALRQQPEIEYAELNMIMHTQLVPNDAYYSTSGSWGQAFRDLWGLQSISAETAWDTTQGDNVVVAVVDTGLDYNHEDITGNVWQNDGEVGLDASGNDKKSNGTDDDGDGLVDDWHGWDFVTIDGTPGDNNPMDDFGHGTHVSGTIAATSNNGLGITGVAPHAKIMAVKGLDANGSGSTDDLSNAIIYAADHGAAVMNNSWGGGPGDTPQTLIDAVTYAHNVKGVVVVAAAGNSGVDVGTQAKGFYPACIRDVITVGAITHTDAKASFSNYGAKLDVAAPGGGDTDPTGLLVSPDRSVLSLLSSAAKPAMTGYGQLVVGTKYLRQAGTSMASPHVAGVAALIRAAQPEFSAEQVRQVIRTSADDIGAAGVDNQFGYGRPNATRALTIATPLMAQLTGPTGTLSGLTQVNVTGSVGGANLANWRLEYGAGTAPASWTQITSATTSVTASVLASWNLSTVNDGTYTLHLVAQSTTGETYEDRLIIVVDSLIITEPSPLSISITRGGGIVTIKGTAAGANFAYYWISILAVGSNTWVNNSQITTPNGGYQPVHDGVLGTWDTTGAAPDTYRIYVTEAFTNGQPVEKSVKIVVDATLHPGWPVDVGALGNGIAGFALTNHLDAYDIDGNGAKDLIIAYNSQVNILDHTGAQLPGWPQTVDPLNTSAHIQISPAVADLDGDGSPEILAANDQNKVFIWRANGTLWAGWPKTLASSFTNIAVDDLNGDGQKEIIITTYGSVRVFDTNGAYLPGWPFFTNTVNSPPAIGDVDGDGQKEIVVATSVGPTKLYMFKANGVVMPGWPRSINPNLASNFSTDSYPVLGDLDGDGEMECVIGSADGLVYAFHSDGSNVAGWPQATKPTYVNGPAIGDIDGDGVSEVVAGNQRVIEGWQSANYIFAWHADGTILPNWPVKYDKTISGSAFGFGPPALVDLDQDGRADVIVSSDATVGAAFAVNAYKSDGSKVAGFPKPTLDTGAFSTNTIAVADFDNDGLLEMAWIDYYHRLYVWDLSAPSTAVAPWPMFQHDAQHSGTNLRTPETLAPSVTITSPANGSLVAGNTNIAVEAADNVAVVMVELYKNNTLVGTLTTSPYNFTWDTTSGTDGAYSFTSKAYDAAGNVGTSLAIILNVDNTAPTASIAAPVDGMIVKGTVAISANAADNSGLQKLDFYSDGNLLETDTTAPFSVNWNTLTTTDAAHSLTVVATDMAGNSTTSAVVSVTVDNTAPTANITAPSNGAIVKGTVAISANAADNSGLQKVDFYSDGNLLGTDTTAPFSVNWNTSTTTNAAHSLTAIATDMVGNNATSAVVSVTVDNIAPTASITAPTNGVIVKGTVAISANAADSSGLQKVDFYSDGNLLGTDTTAPFSVNWNTLTTTDAGHSLTVVATDMAGNSTTSAVVSVTVDNTAPTSSITAPSNGAIVKGTVAISANAADNSGLQKVDFYNDGNFLGTDTAAPFSVNWNTSTTTNAAHSLTAVATDMVGNSATSAVVSVTVDNAPPTVAIVSPVNSAKVGGTAVSIATNAADNTGVAKVQFYRDGSVLLGTILAAPFAFSWNSTTVTAGAHTLFAVATDTAGNTATSAGISVTVDNTLPTVSLTAPANGALLTGASVTLSASASDNNGVSRVDFYRDSSVLLATDNTSPYSVSWNSTSAPSGAHTIYAVATDVAGNTKTSTVVNVTVDNTGPTVTVTAPANGAIVTGTSVTISATASDNVAMNKVEFYRDSAVLLSSDTSSPYSMSWNSTGVTGGAHTLYAVAIDTAGNRTTSGSVNVTVDNTAPTVTITSPANGAQVSRNTTVNINATASDNVGVVKVEFYVNNVLKFTDTASPYSYAWLVPNSIASFSLKAIAYDAAGKTATHTINVTSH